MDCTDRSSREPAGTMSSNRSKKGSSVICHRTKYFGKVARTNRKSKCHQSKGLASGMIESRMAVKAGKTDGKQKEGTFKERNEVRNVNSMAPWCLLYVGSTVHIIY